MKITKRTIDAARPGDRRRFVWDDELRGFGLVIHPPSQRHPQGAKAYVLRYRTLDHRDRRMVLGRHGPLTPTTARGLAIQLLGQVRAGLDPAASRRESRKATTVAGLVEIYTEEHVRKRKPTTAREFERILRVHVLRSLGRRKVGEVSESDVARIHGALESKPYMANRVRAMIHALFAFAERRGLRAPGSNPAAFVGRYAEHKRSRYLSLDELERLGVALEDLDRTNRNAAEAIRLLALLGCRRTEVLGLRRDWLDRERRIIALPDSKSGARLVALGTAALEVLARIPRRGEFLFPSPKRAGAPLRDIRKPLAKVFRAAEIESASAHTFRHTVATVAAELGYSSFIVASLLGHARSGVTGGYIHLTVDGATRAAAEAVQNRIWNALERKLLAPVVELLGAGRMK